MIVSSKKDLVVAAGYNMPTKVLTAGKKYFVYAIDKSKREFYILDDQHGDYPMAYSDSLFDTVDSSQPPNWLVRHSGWGPFKKEFASFPEWVNDAGTSGQIGFYERLVDAEPGSPERSIMAEYKKVADKDLERTSDI